MNFLSKKIDADPVAVDRFLGRGIEAVYPQKDEARKLLLSGKRLRIYFGIDPTGPSVHIGHTIPLLKLRELQNMGHEVILLIGDFTAMIGDPTDKGAARKKLSRKEVLRNLASYKKQLSPILPFSGKNAAKLRFNSSWLSKMSFSDVVELASEFTVQQMQERDMFQKRIAEGKPVHLHEFLYPLMQGYDSVALDTDAEIGGNDQTFNMLAGRTLLRSMKGKEKLVFSTKLLVDPSGKKMGKTEGNMISLTDSPKDMFGKVMSWPDALIMQTYEYCTTVSSETIESEKQFIAQGGNPRDAKLRLAEALVALHHGRKEAEASRDAFIRTFAEKATPSDAPTIKAAIGSALSGILVSEGIVPSKSEYRRLIEAGAIKDMKAELSIKDPDYAVSADIDLKIGKHRFVKIRVK